MEKQTPQGPNLTPFVASLPDGYPLSPCLTSEKRQILISHSVFLSVCVSLHPLFPPLSLPAYVSFSVSLPLSEPRVSLLEQMEPYIPIALRRPKDLKCKRDECEIGRGQLIKGKRSRDFQLKLCSSNKYSIPKNYGCATYLTAPLTWQVCPDYVPYPTFLFNMLWPQQETILLASVADGLDFSCAVHRKLFKNKSDHQAKMRWNICWIQIKKCEQGCLFPRAEIIIWLSD